MPNRTLVPRFPSTSTEARVIPRERRYGSVERRSRCGWNFWQCGQRAALKKRSQEPVSVVGEEAWVRCSKVESFSCIISPVIEESERKEIRRVIRKELVEINIVIDC